ncbi:hypothetical protein [Streptomyces sp. SM12]|uniref:hypothetical protein n=1 Tax=Streptomyces sp. SM12 TaxID=1071602 RepID=UPI0011B0A54B|nr:hypothetical protein [Streptomyces sp. SM12]
MSEVRKMTYADLERWWEVDPNVLATTVVADATGHVHPTVSAALRSEEWLDHWADVLYATVGELDSSAERMTYTGDPRLPRVTRQCGQVHLRMQEANTLLRQRSRAEGRDLMPKTVTDARQAALSLLAKHHREEATKLRAEEIAHRGLAPDPPTHDWGEGPADAFDAIENAVRSGLLVAPIAAQTRRLIHMRERGFIVAVGHDVKQQRERNDGLRHPLLLRRWTAALTYLRDTTAAQAGGIATWTLVQPALDMDALRALPSQQAWLVINRRRFLRGCFQRWRECSRHVQDVVRTVAVRTEDERRPWSEATHASRITLAQRHPAQYRMLRDALEPYTEPGTPKIRHGALTQNQRSELFASLRERLAAS